MIRNGMKNILILFFLLSFCSVFAQEETNEIIKDYNLLEESYENLNYWYYEELEAGKKEQSLLYGKAYLLKGKRENDTLRIAEGYHFISFASDINRSIRYLDSIILITKNIKDFQYPSIAFLSKGTIHYDKREFKKALDNYIEANEYARRNHNPDLIFESNYSVGIIKNTIGNHNEAIKIQREGLDYIKKNNLYEKNNIMYLNTLFALAASLYHVQELDSALYYNKLGIKESLKSNDLDIYNRFVLCSGITNYYKKNFNLALDSIDKALKYLEIVDYKPNKTLAYYYKGRIYYETDKKEKGIVFLKKMDSVFQEEKDILPECRQGYELLIDYYKSTNDKDNRLLYIEKLLEVDSVLNSNYRYLQKNISQNYDTPLLLNEKESVINALKDKNKTSTTLLVVFSGLSIVFLVFLGVNYKKRIAYKKRFEQLFKENEVEKKIIQDVKSNQPEPIGITDDIIQNVLEQLKGFEKKEEFLEPNITTVNLAKKFNTNSKYLSKIIHAYRKKSFINYINELRIEYVIKKLKEDKKFRKYTIKGIAEEIGFNTSEAFSKSFYKKTGIYPSYFLKELERKEMKNI